MRGAKRQCCCVPVARVQQRPEWNVDIPAADGGVPQARNHLAFMRSGAARSAAWKFTMKVIKWAGAGANLFDPAYAHLITPRYEDGLLQAAESPNTLGQDCGVLSASGAC